MSKIRLKQVLMLIVLGLIFLFFYMIGTYYFIISAFFCLIYGLIEPYWLENKETYLVSDKIPSSFEGFKIIFVSDIHHSLVYSRKRLEVLVKKINTLQPDLILLGGDYVNHEKYIQSCFEELKNLKAAYSVCGVLGNHDHRANAEMVVDAMQNAGITCLDNKSVWLEKETGRIKIGGVGDYWNDTQDVYPAIHDVHSDDFVILVSHNPDYAEELKTRQIDLMLCGHTHGGQGTIFGLWAPFIPSRHGQKYKTGLVETPYTKVLISNGTGNVGYLPLRFFARPQINIIYLSKRNN